MTPALPDILVGQAAALMVPLPPEAGGDYLAGRMGMIAMLAGLAAQEAEQGPAARVWENGAIRALLAKAREPAPAEGEADLGWRALDLLNADLRRRLIAAHEAAEARGDAELQTAILELYVQMAAARRLALGPG